MAWVTTARVSPVRLLSPGLLAGSHVCASRGGAADELLLAFGPLAVEPPLEGGNMWDPPPPPGAFGSVTGLRVARRLDGATAVPCVCGTSHQDGGGVSSCLAHADEPLGLL